MHYPKDQTIEIPDHNNLSQFIVINQKKSKKHFISIENDDDELQQEHNQSPKVPITKQQFFDLLQYCINLTKQSKMTQSKIHQIIQQAQYMTLEFLWNIEYTNRLSLILQLLDPSKQIASKNKKIQKQKSLHNDQMIKQQQPSSESESIKPVKKGRRKRVIQTESIKPISQPQLPQEDHSSKLKIDVQSIVKFLEKQLERMEQLYLQTFEENSLKIVDQGPLSVNIQENNQMLRNEGQNQIYYSYPGQMGMLQEMYFPNPMILGMHFMPPGMRPKIEEKDRMRYH